jgi:Xaa-Pro aminopeptidase
MNTAASERLAQFKDALAAAGLDGAVVSKPENVFYLTGVGERMGRPVFAVVGPQRAAVVAPAGGTPTNPDIVVYGYGVPGGIVDRIVDVDQDSDAFLQAAFEQVGLRASRVGFEDSAMSARHAASLALDATFLPLHGELEAAQERGRT